MCDSWNVILDAAFHLLFFFFSMDIAKEIMKNYGIYIKCEIMFYEHFVKHRWHKNPIVIFDMHSNTLHYADNVTEAIKFLKWAYCKFLNGIVYVNVNKMVIYIYIYHFIKV